MKKNGFRGAWTFLRVPKIIKMTRFCLLYLGRPLAHHWCPSLFFNNENVYKFAPKWNHGLKLIPKSNPKSTFRTLARHAKRLQSPRTLLEGKAWRARSTALLIRAWVCFPKILLCAVRFFRHDVVPLSWTVSLLFRSSENHKQVLSPEEPRNKSQKTILPVLFTL